MDDFRFTYSAKEQEEVKRIRQKYQPREEDKMEQLRRMDARVIQKATSVSLIVGSLGALIMGSGMSLIMTEVGEMLGMQGAERMIIGIVVGTIGLVIACLAYPVYSKTVKKEREKIAPEILRLTDELLK